MADSIITIHTSAELAEKVETLAKIMDRSCNSVVEDALKYYIADQLQQISGVQKAIDELNAKQGISHNEIKDTLTKKLRLKLGKPSSA